LLRCQNGYNEERKQEKWEQNALFHIAPQHREYYTSYSIQGITRISRQPMDPIPGKRRYWTSQI
jgi:hypothetical protein